MLEVDEKAGHGALAMEYEHSLMSLARSFARLPSSRFNSLPFPPARHITMSALPQSEITNCIDEAFVCSQKLFDIFTKKNKFISYSVGSIVCTS